MPSSPAENRHPLADAWNDKSWITFYEDRRNKTSDAYPSEWFFLKDLLAEGMSVLDIGCALGGLASVVSEHLRDFSYTGVDISAEMIRGAKARHPSHRFYVIPEADVSVLGGSEYDVVVILGVLHLSRKWREMISGAWARTGKSLLIDLRETSQATVEQEEVSYYQVGQFLGNRSKATLPYNVINSGDALATIVENCKGAVKLQRYGYLAPVSEGVYTPAKTVLMSTYRIDKR